MNSNIKIRRSPTTALSICPVPRKMVYLISESEMCSSWWNFHHWLHRKLSFWQLPVQPTMKISSKWWHSRLNGHLSKRCLVLPQDFHWRFSSTANYMKDFIVTVGDERPPVQNGFDLDHPPFRRCGQYMGTPLTSVPTTIWCDELAVGRYVYVYLPGKNYLQLCEVEAFGLRKLTHWGRDKMAAIFQTTFSSAFSWMKKYEFRLRFHWNLFLGVQLTISQHWFR